MYKKWEHLFCKLRKNLAESVERSKSDGILFSGGLDSTLIAFFSKESRAFSVGFESYGDDEDYANKVAEILNLDHYHRTVKVKEAIEAIPEVISVLKTFDPAIPNDIAIYLGLKYAKDMGMDSVMTGDGGDEIFAGYDFMLKIEDLKEYMAQMHYVMRFSSDDMGRALEVDVRQPFLDKSFMDFSAKIDLDLKIREEAGKTWGKWVLRKAFEGLLPREILWQKKRSIEQGSGMDRLRDVVKSMVSDREFEEGRKKYPVRFWNKEHFYYYRVYREVVGDIPSPKKGEKICECCGAGMDWNALHCNICGEVDVLRIERKP